MLLAVVHALVCFLDDVLGIAITLEVLFQAYRHRNEDLLADEFRRVGFDCLPEALDLGPCGKDVAVFEKDNEFLSAPTADVAARKFLLDHFRRVEKYFVAGLVSV